MSTLDFKRGANHKDCSQTSTDCKRERERETRVSLRLHQPPESAKSQAVLNQMECGQLCVQQHQGKQRPSPVDTYNHMGRYTNTNTDLRPVVSWVAWPTLKLVWPWLAGMASMGVSLTTEAETKRHMCQCVYVYFWVSAREFICLSVWVIASVSVCICSWVWLWWRMFCRMPVTQLGCEKGRDSREGGRWN